MTVPRVPLAGRSACAALVVWGGGIACGGSSQPALELEREMAREQAAAVAVSEAQFAGVGIAQQRAVVGADVVGRTVARADAEVRAEHAMTTAAEVGAEPVRVVPTACSYRTYQWSTVERRAVNRRSVSKAYADVTDEERSPDDPRCTVCSEDQVRVDPAAHGWPDVAPFDVCWAYARPVARALEAIAEDGAFRLLEVTGYRPGQTRGAIVNGNRTEWSNHSFGTAVDINADYNGLYRNCNVLPLDTQRIASCTLGVGGAWRPDAQPDVSVVRDGAVYRAFVEGVGWLWGGEIAGNTKDLMHFSLTGY